MKYDKNTLCFKPFVEAVGTYLPDGRLQSLKGYRVHPKKHPRAAGCCLNVNGWCRITIRTHKYDTLNEKYVALTIEDMLMTLAHELAHLLEWEHTVRHVRLTHQFFGIFINELSRLEIPDVQAEHTILNSYTNDKNGQ